LWESKPKWASLIVSRLSDKVLPFGDLFQLVEPQREEQMQKVIGEETKNSWIANSFLPNSFGIYGRFRENWFSFFCNVLERYQLSEDAFPGRRKPTLGYNKKCKIK